MTIEEFAATASQRPALIGAFLAIPPLLALLGMLGGRDPAGASGRRYLFATLVYLVCIPGIMATVITGYALFFEGANLLAMDVLVYFGPIVSMGLTLMLIARTTPLERVPGFGRIGGLMLMMGAAFFAAFILQRTRIWIVFAGGLGSLLIVGLVLFVAMRFGAARFFGARDEARRPR